MVAAERVLSQRELNRALLARQCLLERGRLTVPRALERIGGIQAQYAPSSYVGLWSRLDGFRREDLDRALVRRQVVQATLMRATIHLVSARDFWLLAEAVRGPRREWFLRVQQTGLTEAELRAAAATADRALATGPLRQAELEEVVGPTARSAVGMFLDLVRVPPSGTWAQRRADLYGRAVDWLGERQVVHEEAVEHAVRRYLAAFGPANRRDIAAWAGLPAREVASALERMSPRRFRAEDGAELVDLPRAPLPDPQTPAPVRFLPTWDAVLLTHARRSQVLPERHRGRVFSTRNPFSVGTVLVDGSVIGTWRLVDGRVQVEDLEPLPRSVRGEVRDEAERLTAFHG